MALALYHRRTVNARTSESRTKKQSEQVKGVNGQAKGHKREDGFDRNVQKEEDRGRCATSGIAELYRPGFAGG